jgi:Fic-DOC domain mobile mystery protein B
MNSVTDLPIPADEVAFLLPSLSTRSQLLEAERLDIHEARIWAMHQKTLQRPDLFSVEFLRELHRRMFRRIWKDAGDFRKTASRQGWEPDRIGEGVRLFADDADAWFKFSTYPAHESAVRLHHRLVSVRPWSHGNGRHARLMADVAVAAHAEPPLTWGMKAAGGRSPRALYLEAITCADNGDMGPLLAFARS